jgi:anti-sigma B factor antagonist
MRDLMHRWRDTPWGHSVLLPVHDEIVAMVPVTVVGEVDTLTAPELATVLTAQLIAARQVVVDLDGVEFFGSAGLSVLFEANEFATEKDRDLRLVCHSRLVNRALEMTGLWQQFTFAENVRDAASCTTNSTWCSPTCYRPAPTS